MPELYGQPRKDELRKEIRELSNDLRNERKGHMSTRHSLEATRARMALLTRKIESLEGKLKNLLAEASQEISSAEIVEEMRRRSRAEIDAILAEANAEAEAQHA